MKLFLIGLMIEIIIIIIYLITKNEKVFIYGTQFISLGSLGVAALLSGVMSKNIYRRTATENKDERFERVGKSTRVILFGLPSIIALIIYYVFIN